MAIARPFLRPTTVTYLFEYWRVLFLAKIGNSLSIRYQYYSNIKVLLFLRFKVLMYPYCSRTPTEVVAQDSLSLEEECLLTIPEEPDSITTASFWLLMDSFYPPLIRES